MTRQARRDASGAAARGNRSGGRVNLSQVVRGLASLAVLLLVLVGAPWLLLRTGRLDVLRHLHASDLTTAGDVGPIILLLLTMLAWASWLLVAATVVSEVVWVLSRSRVRIPVPGGRWLRPIVGVLVVSFIGLLVGQMSRGGGGAAPGHPATPTAGSTMTSAAGGAASSASAMPLGGAPSGSTPSATSASTTPGRASASPVDPAHRGSMPTSGTTPGQSSPAASPGQATAQAHSAASWYIVQSHDDLWSLADKLYGDPTQWRLLAHENHLGSAAVIDPGDALRIPHLAQDEVNRRTGQRGVDTTSASVVVHHGDTLASLAEQHLGSASYWPALQRANATLVQYADRIEPGWVLQLPPRLMGRTPATTAPTGAASASVGHGTGTHGSPAGTAGGSPVSRQSGGGVQPGSGQQPRVAPTPPTATPPTSTVQTPGGAGSSSSAGSSAQTPSPGHTPSSGRTPSARQAASSGAVPAASGEATPGVATSRPGSGSASTDPVSAEQIPAPGTSGGTATARASASATSGGRVSVVPTGASAPSTSSSAAVAPSTTKPTTAGPIATGPAIGAGQSSSSGSASATGQSSSSHAGTAASSDPAHHESPGGVSSPAAAGVATPPPASSASTTPVRPTGQASASTAEGAPASPAAPARAVPASTATAGSSDRDVVAMALAGLALSTAAGIMGALRWRRRGQRFARPLGRRPARPDGEALRLESVLARAEGVLADSLPDADGKAAGGHVARRSMAEPPTASEVDDLLTSRAEDADERGEAPFEGAEVFEGAGAFERPGPFEGAGAFDGAGALEGPEATASGQDAALALGSWYDHALEDAASTQRTDGEPIPVRGIESMGPDADGHSTRAGVAGVVDVTHASTVADTHRGARALDRVAGAGADEGPNPGTGAIVADEEPRRGASAVVVGEGPTGLVCSDLVDAGHLVVVGSTQLVRESAAALALGVATAPWSQGVEVHVVSSQLDWLERLDEPQLMVEHDLDHAIAHVRRATLAEATSESPDQGADADPEVVAVWLFDLSLLAPDDQLAMLLDVCPGSARAGHATVWLTSLDIPVVRVAFDDVEVDDRGDLLELRDDEHAELTGVPAVFRPNLLAEPARRALVELFESATSTDTELAPWWSSNPVTTGRPNAGYLTPAPSTQDSITSDAITSIPITAARASQDAEWNEQPSPDSAPPELGVLTALPTTASDAATSVRPGRLALERRPDTEHPEDAMARIPDSLAHPDHPTLLMLGEVELLGARGSEPTRARKQCLEYCAWLLANPRQTAVTMTRSLLVAETTRRSNMSRLRSWLGSTDEGDDYLPDAYSGRIQLHSAVTSDWEYLQLLISAGINRASDDALVEALELVRGAPLADAAPGQWHWAEELRTQMCQTVRDIGLLLAQRALDQRDIDLARWAACRGLVVEPEDELLLAMRIRTEHAAGNRPEVERLVLRVTRAARDLGVDLTDETVVLLQQVMEGRVRARA